MVIRAGIFGTKILATTFVSDETEVFIGVQERFEVNISEIPMCGKTRDIYPYEYFTFISSCETFTNLKSANIDTYNIVSSYFVDITFSLHQLMFHLYYLT